MNYLRALFGKRHCVNLIREGSMYQLTFKGGRLVKEERVDVFGGFTELTVEGESKAVGDRSRTDLYRSPVPEKPVNFTKEPDVL